MSEGEKISKENPAPMGASSVGSGRLVSRRRLIKAGALSAPVGLTLASQPVIATTTTCSTTSAWGSTQINPTNSTTARHAPSQQVINVPTISGWKNGTSSWTQLGIAVDVTNANAANYYRKLTFNQVFGGNLGLSGISGTDKVYDKILTSPSRDWNTYMIVARLNFKLESKVRTCLTNQQQVDQLALMATGSYTPSNLLLSQPWLRAQIQDYLEANYIVRP